MKGSGLGRALTVTLALACAITSSNIYINQPVLTEMARSLGVSDGAMGAVPTATQFGYALGILLLVPLGDTRDRRKLILGLSAAATVALAATALAPNLAVLTVCSLLLGVLTPVPQIVIPLAVALAPGEGRGRIVGILQGGLLVGLLASRAYAGALADLVGWRWVYGCSVGLMIALEVILFLTLPRGVTGGAPLGYRELLRSLPHTFAQSTLVRRVCVSGALVGVSFGAFWTTLAFVLQDSYGYGPGIAGLFGLVAAASALASPRAGRMADRVGGRRTQTILLAVSLLGWVALLGGKNWLALLVLGVILLDVGVWGNQVVNQAMLFTLADEKHSRLNTLYFTFRFLGIASGSLLGSQLWDAGGWYAVGTAGVAALLLAAPILFTTRDNRPVPEASRGAARKTAARN
ncbi:MFS transporter [Streptomyces silvisoli]|uniref:MFS transporter n=1 Tax=Streptomyces silvisoli TaxID=3034235 RepID=A0ABT5ZRF6_9ACTN|nr:MFS transporter [Streptomyces silvisoli]MDF3291653.1 MFS transporter [Streptomyces silvisoli]